MDTSFLSQFSEIKRSDIPRTVALARSGSFEAEFLLEQKDALAQPLLRSLVETLRHAMQELGLEGEWPSHTMCLEVGGVSVYTPEDLRAGNVAQYTVVNPSSADLNQSMQDFEGRVERLRITVEQALLGLRIDNLDMITAYSTLEASNTERRLSSLCGIDTSTSALRENLLSGFRRLLKPGGLLLFTSFPYEANYFPPDLVQDYAELVTEGEFAIPPFYKEELRRAGFVSIFDGPLYYGNGKAGFFYQAV